MPKLNRFIKRNTPELLDTATKPKDRERITTIIKAIEGYVMLSCIAIGILQLLSLKYPSQNWSAQIRFLRTPSKQNLSEATMADCIRKVFFLTLAKTTHLPLTQIIMAKQENPEDFKLLDVF